MNRTEIEIKLNKDRAWTLETWAAYSAEDLTRGITVSRHNPEFSWSAKDHLAHLAGIEAVFNTIIKKFIAGDPNPISIMKNPDGTAPSREEIMAKVHAMNDDWVSKNVEKSFLEIVALGQQIRASTLALLAELSDAQLEEKIPGAQWGDGTVGGIIAINGDHAKQHFGWVTAGLEKPTV
jgi:DinB superfamily